MMIKRIAAGVTIILLACAPYGVQAAVSKLSQIVSGGTYVPTTDKLVTVRNGNTDVLTAINVAVATGQDFGMACDGNAIYDMTLTQSSATVSSTSYTFTAADIGKHINVSATNMKSAANKTTTISSVSGGNAVLATTWTATTVSGTGVAVTYTTDDTTAFNTALSTLHTQYPNGSELILKGYCVVGAVTIYRQQLVGCSNGYQSCELIEKPGTNANWITSENQAALTGTGANYGTNALVPSFFGFEDIHLNGNAPAQSAGDCVDFYGNAEIIKGNNLIESCWGNGLHTEAANLFPYDPSDWRAEEEGFIDHLTIRDAGTYGWLHQGPHDTVLLDYVSFQNGSYGYISQTSGSLYTGSLHAEKMHVYADLDSTAFNIDAPLTAQEVYSDFGTTVFGANAATSTIDHLFYTACGTGGLNCLTFPSGVFNIHIAALDIQMLNTASNLVAVDIQAGSGNIVIDSYQMSNVTPGANVTAFKIRSPFVTLGTGVISNFQSAGDICFDLQGSTFVNISGTGFSCSTFFSFGSGDNNNTINFQAYTAGGTETLTSGTSGVNDVLNIGTDSGQQTISYPNMYIGNGAIQTLLYDNGNSGTSKAIAFNNGNFQKATVTGAVAFTFTAPTHPQAIHLKVIQDGSGHVYSLPASIKWPGAVVPTYSTAAGAVDIFSCLYDGSEYDCMSGINFH